MKLINNIREEDKLRRLPDGSLLVTPGARTTPIQDWEENEDNVSHINLHIREETKYRERFGTNSPLFSVDF